MYEIDKVTIVIRTDLANQNAETTSLIAVIRAELTNQNAKTNWVSITSVAKKCFSLLGYL